MRCDHVLSLGQNHRDARSALIIHTGYCYEPCAQTIHMLMVKDYQEQFFCRISVSLVMLLYSEVYTS
jgi:hypothetical protein